MFHNPRSGIGHFIRGAELWMHQLRLFLTAIRTVLVVALLIGVIGCGIFFWKTTTTDERYALTQYTVAYCKSALSLNANRMTLSINHQLYQFTANEVMLLTEQMAHEALNQFSKGIYFGLSLSCLAFLCFAIYWATYGKAKIQDKQLRGSQLVTDELLAKLLFNRQDASPYCIAGVPMRKNSETLHTLIGGAQGTGKSQQFFALMKQVRARGKRMVIYDPTGEFTQAFYREGEDIIMNPLDQRSPNWNIWCEIAKDYHFDNMANGLIPEPAEADPFWSLAARAVLKDVYRVLGRENKRTNKDLYQAIAKSNLETIHAMLKGTAGATYVDPMTERTGMSLKMTVQNQLDCFRFLHDDGALFSIRKWIQAEGDSWMFITARESMREALKPILSLWIDTAIKAVLDLAPVHRERLWFCIDELPTLQRLDILKLALTNTRKYGLCMVLGVQDFSQLYEIYGHDLAKTIISGCQTKLLLRVTDGSAAKLLSELLGQVEVDEKAETLSYGVHAQRDGISFSTRRSMRNVILASEILTLPDMTGYLVVPGDYPIAKVAYRYVPAVKRAEGFIERGGIAVEFGILD